MKGDTVERAPIHNKSISFFKASSTCLGFATSVAVNNPVSSFALFNHFKPISPTPSKFPGLVLGFHIPARNTVASVFFN